MQFSKDNREFVSFCTTVDKIDFEDSRYNILYT